MSQVETAKKSGFARLKERFEPIVRDFEWNWTKAVLFSLGFSVFILVSTSVLPSFWLYFADQKLHWDGSGPQGFWLKELRDIVAMGGVTTPIIVSLVVAAIMQNWRRKLRGQTDSRASGGYR